MTISRQFQVVGDFKNHSWQWEKFDCIKTEKFSHNGAKFDHPKCKSYKKYKKSP